MNKKDNLKLVFDFIAEYLNDEESKIEVKTEVKTEVKEILTEKDDDSAKHILEVMKRAELMDKMRSTVIARPKLVPPSLRDDDEISENDREMINTHKTENGYKNIKNILSGAKGFMDELENKKPLVPSIPLHELAEKELAKSIVKVEEEKTKK
jgi:hypothetical protein